MKFAKSNFCSPNVIWVREILIIVRQVKFGSPTKIGFANLIFRQIVRQVALTHLIASFDLSEKFVESFPPGGLHLPKRLRKSLKLIFLFSDLRKFFRVG